MIIQFPENPAVGQEYVLATGVTYVWVGDRWSAARALETGVYQYTIDGGYADFEFNPDIDNELNGGTA